ncbi:Gfo/Idh/MocA family oxidoreductase, partial [Candidatus Poribacteria bacterium]|nr:Gfo/Idh/MocA family oxidoreductase [Candidatus Poribacteria bacterium]
MTTSPLNLALVGFGNIGTGVVRHLAQHGRLIDGRLPRPVRLKTICDVDIQRDRGVSTRGFEMTSDYRTIIQDKDIEVVIELVGGTGIAREIVMASLAAGKHVVTANKALIAKHGRELHGAAQSGRVHLLYEASVGAGIPIIESLQSGLQPNRVTGLIGILNGTCNYILT